MTALANYLQAGVASRRGTREQAANHVRAALAQLDWDDHKIVYEDSDYRVYLDDALEPFTCYVEHAAKRMVISPDTWDVLGCDVDASDAFMADMIQGGTGMHFVVTDKDPYRRAVRKHAERTGTNVTQAKDAITELTEQANALVVQAASLNTAPTSMQQQVFAVRYATMQVQMEALEERMNQLRGLVDLAGTAVFDVGQ